MSFNAQSLSKIAKITLISFMINAILPFFVVYVPANAAISTPQIEQLVVCTSQGIKRIDQTSFLDGSYLDKLDQYPNVENDTSQQHQHHYECALCFIAQLHLDTFSNANNAGFHSLDNHQRFVSTIIFNLPNKPIRKGFDSRAPPFNAVHFG